MDVQSQLLIILPEHKIYGGRTKEGSQTGPAHPRVSLSRPTATGGNACKTIPQKK